MARKDASTPPDAIPITRADARPPTTHSEPVTPKALPSDLQSLVDRSDSLYESLYDGTAPDTTTSSVRYAAYATRFRTILLSAQRYVAYTSDIGESFRPVAHPWLIRGAYGVSWAYLCGDVANEGYKAYVRNQRIAEDVAVDTNSTADVGADKRAALTERSIPTAALQRQQIPAIEDYRAVMAQRAVFQSLASMGLPAFTIHSIVRYSGRAMKDVANKRLRSWGPIGLGLAVVPFLPFVFDEPVEQAVEWTFHHAFEAIGGTEAVGTTASTGREADLQVGAKVESLKEKGKRREGKEKEKEL